MRRFVSPALLLVVLALVARADLCRAEGPAAPQPPPASVPSAAAAGPSAHIEVEKDVVDLGQVVRGAKAEATFVLKNSGPGELKILSAKPG